MKRFLSMLMAVIMVLGVFPISVMAEETEQPVTDAVPENASVYTADCIYVNGDPLNNIENGNVVLNGETLEINITQEMLDYLAFDLEQVDENNDVVLYIGFKNADGSGAYKFSQIVYTDMAEEGVAEFFALDEASEFKNEYVASTGDIPTVPFYVGNVDNGRVSANGSGTEYANYCTAWYDTETGEISYSTIKLKVTFPEEGSENEWHFPEESTAVTDQVMNVYFENKLIASGNIVDGAVEITVPYFSDETIEVLKADGKGRKRARIALQISDGYDDENITHYMGGFGENIMTYVNWEETYNNDDEINSYEEFLLEYYWEIDQLGIEGNDGSVIKYELAKFTEDNKERYLVPDDPFSDRLYIQYFDANNEEAVAYEHVDVTIKMAEPKIDTMVPVDFGQVYVNGFCITEDGSADEIGYSISGEGDSRTAHVIVEANAEQLWNHSGEADGMGNIYTVYEIAAPSNNVEKFILAKRAEDALALENITAEDFTEVYSKNNMPAIADTIAYFEDGELYLVFEGEKSRSYVVAWLENDGDIIYQNIEFTTVMPVFSDNGEGGDGEEGGNDDICLSPEINAWEGEFVEPDQVSINAHPNLMKALSLSFNNGVAILDVDLDKLSPEDWIAAYEETGGTESQITAMIEVKPPVDGINEAYDANGNGHPSRDQFINDSNNNGHFEYDEYCRTGGWGELGQIFKEDGEVTIIPSVREDVHYFRVAWYNTNDETAQPIYQIMPYYMRINGVVKSVSFEDTLNYVPNDRIIFDGKINESGTKLSASFDEHTSHIIYKYNYSDTVNENTPKAILDDLFKYGNDYNYHLVTKVQAPAGYKHRGEEDTVIFLYTNCENDGVVCGHERTWELEWELIDKTQVSENPEFITEYITIDFDPGINFMDVYWDPITDESRFTYYTRNDTKISRDTLIDGGLTMELSKGIYDTGFDNSKNFDVKRVPNAMISIGVPDDGNKYVAYKIGESGGGRNIYFDSALSNDANNSMLGDDFFEIGDWRTRCINLAQFSCENVDGIDVWFTGNAGGEQVMLIDWYTSTEEGAMPAKREYLAIRTDNYTNEETFDAQETITSAVTDPTPLGTGWQLSVSHYPQEGRNDAYYFQMEAEGNVPEDGKVIYIPYSYLDEELTYEEAVNMELQPKLHHYDEGHTKIELIDGELTEYGMKFVVESFSPFVVELYEEKPVNTGTTKYPEIAEFRIPEALRGFITSEYDPETGCITVTVNKGTIAEWEEAYKKIGATDESIIGDIILTAPEGTVKEYSMMGDVDFEMFKNMADDPDSSNFRDMDQDWPYVYRGHDFIHINRSGGKVIFTPQEWGTEVAVAWVDGDGNISYQMVSLCMVINSTESVRIDDIYKNIGYADASRITIAEMDSQFFSPYIGEDLNYVEGDLTFKYTGTKTDIDSISEELIDEAKYDFNGMHILVEAPEEGYYAIKYESFRKSNEFLPEDEITEVFLSAEYYDRGNVIFSPEEFIVYWQNIEEPYDIIAETVNIVYDLGFPVRWMDKYWKPVSYSEAEGNNNRIEIFAEENEEYTNFDLAKLAKAGVRISCNNGHYDVSYDEDIDIVVARDVVGYIRPMEGAAFYIANGCGGPGDDVAALFTSEEQNDLLNTRSEMGEFIPVSNQDGLYFGLSGFEKGVIEDLGIEFWHTIANGNIQIVLVDWYDIEYNRIGREYVYVTYGDYVNRTEEEAQKTITESVVAPTPVGEGWFLTCNHYPQFGGNNRYFFELEASGETPDGEKIIYLPYSFIEEGLTFDEAKEMGLEPKIHHYYDNEFGEKQLLEGRLTEYGIEFVVTSFSPFVLDWNEGVTVSVEETVIFAGTTGTVNVNIGEGSGASMIQFYLEYDPEELDIVSVKPGKLLENYNPSISFGDGKISFAWDSEEVVLTEGGSVLEIEVSAEDKMDYIETYIGFNADAELEEENGIYALDENGDPVSLTAEFAGANVIISPANYGDVNLDGEVNVMDAHLVRLYLVHLEELSEAQKIAANVDGNSKVNIVDCNYIRRYVAKIIDSFPAEN